MRVMEKDGQRLEVREHIMTQNMWEFYVLEEPDQDGVSFAFVSGDCSELGYVSLDEIKPFIISRTKQMDEILPAPGFSWVDN